MQPEKGEVKMGQENEPVKSAEEGIELIGKEWKKELKDWEVTQMYARNQEEEDYLAYNLGGRIFRVWRTGIPENLKGDVAIGLLSKHVGPYWFVLMLLERGDLDMVSKEKRAEILEKVGYGAKELRRVVSSDEGFKLAQLDWKLLEQRMKGVEEEAEFEKGIRERSGKFGDKTQVRESIERMVAKKRKKYEGDFLKIWDSKVPDDLKAETALKILEAEQKEMLTLILRNSEMKTKKVE